MQIQKNVVSSFVMMIEKRKFCDNDGRYFLPIINEII